MKGNGAVFEAFAFLKPDPKDEVRLCTCARARACVPLSVADRERACAWCAQVCECVRLRICVWILLPLRTCVSECLQSFGGGAWVI